MIISEYFSENKSKRAVVYKNVTGYFIHFYNQGMTVDVVHSNLLSYAEDMAEDYILWD